MVPSRDGLETSIISFAIAFTNFAVMGVAHFTSGAHFGLPSPMSGPVLSSGTPSTPVCVIFFGVRILLGTILGRFSIIYFRGLGLRIRVMVWVMVRARVRVWSCGWG